MEVLNCLEGLHKAFPIYLAISYQGFEDELNFLSLTIQLADISF